MAASCSGGGVRRYRAEMAKMLHGASGQKLLRANRAGLAAISVRG
eukprot:COSAG01_NODE_1083_length_11812_cov_9.648510_1_plen_45_part_00